MLLDSPAYTLHPAWAIKFSEMQLFLNMPKYLYSAVDTVPRYICPDTRTWLILAPIFMPPLFDVSLLSSVETAKFSDIAVKAPLTNSLLVITTKMS